MPSFNQCACAYSQSIEAFTAMLLQRSQAPLQAKFLSSEITEDDAFQATSAKFPKKVAVTETRTLFLKVTDPVILYHRKLLEDQSWQFFVVEQKRGYCYYSDRRITIPLWAVNYKRKKGYLDWYVSHEIAHAFAGPMSNHGPYFMAWLHVICPKEAIHFELTYKPRNAKASGISNQATS